MNTFVITTLHFNVLYHSLVQLPANTDEFQPPPLFFFKSKHGCVQKYIIICFPLGHI